MIHSFQNLIYVFHENTIRVRPIINPSCFFDKKLVSTSIFSTILIQKMKEETIKNLRKK